MFFSEFPFHPKILAGIKACGYKNPTAIQEQAIPPALMGQDILGLAQTGTGKSAVFVLPILERLMFKRQAQPRALILSPTRELAEQTTKFVQSLGQKTDLRSLAIYGGISRSRQIRNLRSGVDIVVACPGRLLDLMQDRCITLLNVEILVLDEGDRMLDMGFMPDIQSILKKLPSQRQNMFFSATMPKDISSLAEEILNNPTWVQIDHKQPLQGITQCLYPVDRSSKPKMLLSLLQQKKSEATLVFTRTKHMATKLAARLSSAGLRAGELQGNMSQQNRHQVLQGFKQGSFNILVATDIASRGIDVTRIRHVINYDMPDTAEAYVHRIGRTGRAASPGEASTFVEPKDFKLIKAIERAQDKRIQRKTINDLA